MTTGSLNSAGATVPTTGGVTTLAGRSLVGFDHTKGQFVNSRIRARRTLRALAGVAALGASMITFAAPAADAAPTHLFATSARPLADQFSPTTARTLSGRSSATIVITPMTDTPDGYKLIHPGYRRSSYVYDSDWVYQGDYRCSNGECILQAETRLKIHEYVYGGSSHYWSLRYDAQTVKNPGLLSWQFHDRYYCGVNVAHQSDPICTNGASASGTELAFSPGESIHKTWVGRTASPCSRWLLSRPTSAPAW